MALIETVRQISNINYVLSKIHIKKQFSLILDVVETEFILLVYVNYI